MNKNTIILMVVVAAISAGVTRYFFPQLEYKNTETVKEVVRNDVRTIVKEIVKADGSKEIVTEIVDRSTRKETSTSETIVAAKKQWMLDLGVRKTYNNTDVYYDAQIQRRVLGPFFLGAKVSTDKSLGVSVGMEF